MIDNQNKYKVMSYKEPKNLEIFEEKQNMTKCLTFLFTIFSIWLQFKEQ